MPDIEKLLKKAIHNMQQIAFIYEGLARTANPHHLGIMHGELQIHAYQVGNGSHSDGLPEWRNFKVKNIADLKILNTYFSEESTYNPANAHYEKILKQIS